MHKFLKPPIVVDTYSTFGGMELHVLYDLHVCTCSCICSVKATMFHMIHCRLSAIRIWSVWRRWRRSRGQTRNRHWFNPCSWVLPRDSKKGIAGLLIQREPLYHTLQQTRPHVVSSSQSAAVSLTPRAFTMWNPIHSLEQNCQPKCRLCPCFATSTHLA